MKKEFNFSKELLFIKDACKREWCRQIINTLPDYIFEVPASSTGKYHPSYCLGKGGLIRHIKACVKIAVELFNIYNFDESQQDNIIIALLLHDGLKSGIGNSGHTEFAHPLLMAEFIRDKFFGGMNSIQIGDLTEIIKLISSHMGKWNTNKYSSSVLPVPKTNTEKFVHMCDYLASRKFLEVDLK